MGKKGAARDETTRGRLLAAAVEVFAREGFEGATTRQIASRAGVNLAAIPYYFGTKEGLYLAVFEAFLARAGQHLDARRQEAQARLADGAASPEELLELLISMLLDLFGAITSDEIGPFTPLAVREHMMPGKAFDLLYERLIRREHETLTALVAGILDLGADEPEALFVTQTLLGQVVAFLVGRNMLLRRLGKTRYADEDRDTMRRVLVENVRAVVAARKGR